MLSITDLPLNATVSFDLYPAALLGTSLKNAKVLAILDADTARFFIDPPVMHANVFATLPPGTPNRFDGYPYVKLKLPNGTVTAIGLPWIKDETLVVATTTRVLITVDNVTPAGQNTILAALSANGFSAAKIEVIP